MFGVHRSSYRYWKNRPEKPDGRQYSLCITGPYTCRMQLHQQRRMLIYTSEDNPDK
ncbi:putative transposase [Escherichia coli DEC11C]|nr:putative transposase [Escherichia coli DEC11C]EHX01696.1 putative transposase [Escherichia coli DEC11C]